MSYHLGIFTYFLLCIHLLSRLFICICIIIIVKLCFIWKDGAPTSTGNGWT